MRKSFTEVSTLRNKNVNRIMKSLTHDGIVSVTTDDLHVSMGLKLADQNNKLRVAFVTREKPRRRGAEGPQIVRVIDIYKPRITELANLS